VCTCEHSNMTNSTTELEFLKVMMALPSIKRSCPCDPTSVLDRNGAKSTIISLNNGQTDPNANSNFWVKVASRDGVETGSGFVDTNDLMFKSSGRDLESGSFDGFCCIGDNIAISPLTRSPRSFWSLDGVEAGTSSLISVKVSESS
jgi:hypothetical protein